MSRYQLEVEEFDRRHQLLMRGISFVGATFVIIVAFWSAGLPPAELWMRTQQWFADSDSKASKPTPAQAVPASAVLTTSSPATPAPPAESLAGTDSSVSEVALPLYLLAVAPGRNVHEGTALVGTTPENPQTYAAGALLANGAQLAEIYRDHIVLKRDDRTASLSLYQRSKAQTAARERDDLLSVGGNPKGQPLAASSHDILTDYLRPSPVYDGEQLQGYQVYPGQKSGVFARLGLQPGDVIVAINDSPLIDPAQAIQLLHQITTGMAVVATVMRKSQSRSERITLDGAVIVSDQDQSRNAHVDTAMLQPPT